MACDLARLKSVTFRTPWAEIPRLAGFTSRWMIWARAASPSPAAAWAPISATTPLGSGPRSSSSFSVSPPSSSSMAK